jgi:hypothetical protein
MTGDIDTRERLVVVPSGEDAPEMAGALASTPAQLLHRYGRDVLIVAVADVDESSVAESLPGAAAPATADAVDEAALEGLDEAGRLGVEALALRSSAAFAEAKASRRLEGAEWDTADAQTPGCVELVSGDSADAPSAQALGAEAAAPLSQRLMGSVAVGLVIVEGPTSDLQFTNAQRAKIVAETQNGLSWLGSQNPAAPVAWSWDVRNVRINVAADAPAADNEARFRDPALGVLGFGPGFAGVTAYAESLRTRFRTDWAYVAFFTQYPVNHFAYAYIGGPHLVMDYDNDGWGPDNIDRVFAHETGHIFNAPDEYASSGCNCGGSWGFYGQPNGNCENCAAGGGVACLMRANTWSMCSYTPWHLGFPLNPPRLLINNFGYTAGGWRVDKHPRVLADVHGDGRNDVVGFGNAGVYVSDNNGGTFSAPQLRVNNFGYSAGGWRVERHPRFLADTTGDGRADIVGFGNAGVYVARSTGTGFAGLQLVVNNFGYSAGGWRVERHPRFLADTTGDGRADIVGFGNAGVYVSRSNPDGSFSAPQLVVNNFGYDAGGWRVNMHPRFLADTTGDGRADIVGFGNAGVYVSRSTGTGFTAPQLVVGNFGYSAGGWRVERHPRFLADTTGDGRADIVGFGNAGVYVSRSTGTGFTAPRLVVTNFGYDAGGWRVDLHPRFVVDANGNGKADFVGFGYAGLYVSFSS